MKKTPVFALILVVIFLVSPAASAFELSGDVWVITDQENKGSDELNAGYRGQLTLMNFGPVSMLSEFQLLGSAGELSNIASLWREELDEEDLLDMDDVLAIADLTGKVRVDWPLFGGTYLIGAVGYRFSGHFYHDQAENEVGYGLYQGLTYSGGVGKELVRGLRAYGLVEYGPALKAAYSSLEEPGDAEFAGIDVGLEYRIPFLLARGGFRSQRLTDTSEYSHKFSGVYVGAGFHF